ncbi:MAG: DUF4397 domain-containing protein [Angustibacter sp.]
MRNSIKSPIRMATAVAVGLAPVAGAAFLAPTASAAETGKVTVVHGIPGVKVDVYVDGKAALEDFTFKTVTPQIDLPAGDRKIDIRPAGADASSKAILSTSATVTAGLNATIVANLDAAGKPAANIFVNPTTAVPSSMGRVIVRHTAAAPAVDILAGGTAVVKNLTNPNEKSLMVPAGPLAASVALAGSTTPVLGPLPLTVAGGKTTVIYAIGSAKDKTLTAVLQSYDSTAKAPSSVPSGEGTATSGFGPAGMALVGGLGVAGLAFAAGTGLRRRSAVRG